MKNLKLKTITFFSFLVLVFIFLYLCHLFSLKPLISSLNLFSLLNLLFPTSKSVGMVSWCESTILFFTVFMKTGKSKLRDIITSNTSKSN